MTLKELKNDEKLNKYIEKADEVLKSMNYTEHSFQHVNIVSQNAKKILKSLGYSNREIELVGIAGYMHDIGNVLNRHDHAQNGALLAHNYLSNNTNLELVDILDICSAIGHHDEGTAFPINSITAALIIADKCDARRNRVRSKMGMDNIHYRVNFAVVGSNLEIDNEKKTIDLYLTIDTSICSVMEYFDIFMDRTKLCIQSAKVLGATFNLHINNLCLT